MMTNKKIFYYTKYIMLFFFFFFGLVYFYTLSKNDTYVNFGFSYAISIGEVPYRDFNMVVTPFAPFLYSIGLLFSKSIIIYYLEQAILLTIMFYFLFKLLGEKAWLFLVCLCIPYPVAMVSTLFPGYNFLAFFLFVILIYLEQNKKSDYLIGFILGLIFCSKQTIGLSLFVPCFYYLIKDRVRFAKRLVGYIIPVFILVIYLIVSHSLYNFIDLCFLGLFDFGDYNHSIDVFYLLLFIFSFLFLFAKTLKNKHNIIYYYALCFSIVVVPIVDYYHVSLFLLVFIYVFLGDYNLKREHICKQAILFIISLAFIWFGVEKIFLKDMVITSYHNFEITITSRRYINNVFELNEYLDNKDCNVIYLLRGSENYFYKIINDKEIDYFDLPNYGNYGYDGVNKILNRLRKISDAIFVIDKSLYNNTDDCQQYIKELSNEVRQFKNIKTIGNYDIYYKE